MLVQLEIEHALKESDKFKFVRLAWLLLLVQLISGKLLVDRRSLGQGAVGRLGVVERFCTVNSGRFRDLTSNTLS